MRLDPETIGLRMDALGIWDVLAPYNFAVKPRGTVFPYFCTAMKGDGNPVKVRFLMLEGWQTLHDFVRTRIDVNFGFHSSPMEFPRFELVLLADGSAKVFRYDTGFLPQEVTEGAARELVAKLLWESYGVFLRVEGDRRLPLRFADDRAVFARVEDAAGTWADAPLAIPDPPPHQETVSLPKDLVRTAKDLPLAADEVLALDFRLLPGIMTTEARPRCVYELLAVDGRTGEKAFESRVSLTPEVGLRALWEGLPVRVLQEIVRRGRVPGAVRVRSGRVFRMLRPLCFDLPFWLSLHDRLDAIPHV